jgi:enoyl-CoA hydratase/carnithine racemase
MMCDVRFLSTTARMSTAFARRGLPGEHGIAWLLPRIVGVERALDLLLSARTVDADEALRIGLVGFVAPAERLLDMALGYARDVATNCSPTSLAFLKHQVLTDLDASYDEGLARSYRAMAFCAAGSDFREGIDSFLAGRPPMFPPLRSGFSVADVTGAEIPALDIDPKDFS